MGESGVQPPRPRRPQALGGSEGQALIGLIYMHSV